MSLFCVEQTLTIAEAGCPSVSNQNPTNQLFAADIINNTFSIIYQSASIPPTSSQLHDLSNVYLLPQEYS